MLKLSGSQGIYDLSECGIDSSIEGKIIVKVLVDTEGNVLKIGSYSGPEIFYEEVSSKIINLKFTPARIENNVSVKCWVSIPLVFKLPKQNNNIEK